MRPKAKRNQPLDCSAAKTPLLETLETSGAQGPRVRHITSRLIQGPVRSIVQLVHLERTLGIGVRLFDPTIRKLRHGTPGVGRRQFRGSNVTVMLLRLIERFRG